MKDATNTTITPPPSIEMLEPEYPGEDRRNEDRRSAAEFAGQDMNFGHAAPTKFGARTEGREKFDKPERQPSSPMYSFNVGQISASVPLTEQQHKEAFEAMLQLQKASIRQVKFDTFNKAVNIGLGMVGIVASVFAIYLGVRAKSNDR